MWYSTSYADPGNKMREHLCFHLLFYFRVRLGTWQGSTSTVQPPRSLHRLLATLKIINPFYNLNCSAWERTPDAGLQKRATFSTLNIGLAGTGNQTRATCVASSVVTRSAIHYTYIIPLLRSACRILVDMFNHDPNYVPCGPNLDNWVNHDLNWVSPGPNWSHFGQLGQTISKLCRPWIKTVTF
jgi:hypothetical protein